MEPNTSQMEPITIKMEPTNCQNEATILQKNILRSATVFYAKMAPAAYVFLGSFLVQNRPTLRWCVLEFLKRRGFLPPSPLCQGPACRIPYSGS